MSTPVSQIPVLVFCGGKGIYVDASGCRLNKALVPIAGLPMASWVIRLYARHGFRRFFLAAGIQADRLSQALSHVPDKVFPSDLTWEVMETGPDATTWERLGACEDRLASAPVFSLAYCDALADIDLTAMLHTHEKNGTILSLAAVFQPTRFRLLGLRPPDPLVRGFAETPILRTDRINGGFYFTDRRLFAVGRGAARESNGSVSLEGAVLERLIKDRQVAAIPVNAPCFFLDGERDIEAMTGLAHRVV